MELFVCKKGYGLNCSSERPTDRPTVPIVTDKVLATTKFNCCLCVCCFCCYFWPTSDVKKRIRQLPKNYPKNTCTARSAQWRRPQAGGGAETREFDCSTARARPDRPRSLIKNAPQRQSSSAQQWNLDADTYVVVAMRVLLAA